MMMLVVKVRHELAPSMSVLMRMWPCAFKEEILVIVIGTCFHGLLGSHLDKGQPGSKKNSGSIQVFGCRLVWEIGF